MGRVFDRINRIYRMGMGMGELHESGGMPPLPLITSDSCNVVHVIGRAAHISFFYPKQAVAGT